jgi:hypothetical protein
MARKIRVAAVFNKEPHIKLYVLALLGLARQLQEDEQQSGRVKQSPAVTDKSEDRTDG